MGKHRVLLTSASAQDVQGLLRVLLRVNPYVLQVTGRDFYYLKTRCCKYSCRLGALL